MDGVFRGWQKGVVGSSFRSFSISWAPIQRFNMPSSLLHGFRGFGRIHGIGYGEQGKEEDKDDFQLSFLFST
jgi:hypothetical protein